MYFLGNSPDGKGQLLVVKQAIATIAIADEPKGYRADIKEPENKQLVIAITVYCIMKSFYKLGSVLFSNLFVILK